MFATTPRRRAGGVRAPGRQPATEPPHPSDTSQPSDVYTRLWVAVERARALGAAQARVLNKYAAGHHPGGESIPPQPPRCDGVTLLPVGHHPDVRHPHSGPHRYADTPRRRSRSWSWAVHIDGLGRACPPTSIQRVSHSWPQLSAYVEPRTRGTVVGEWATHPIAAGTSTYANGNYNPCAFSWYAYTFADHPRSCLAIRSYHTASESDVEGHESPGGATSRVHPREEGWGRASGSFIPPDRQLHDNNVAPTPGGRHASLVTRGTGRGEQQRPGSPGHPLVGQVNCCSSRTLNIAPLGSRESTSHTTRGQYHHHTTGSYRASSTHTIGTT